MKLNSLLISALLSFSSLTFAAATNSYINGIYAGVEGLEYEALNGDQDYMTVAFLNVSKVDTGRVPSKYDLGGRYYAGIRFNKNYDLSGSWTRFNTKLSDFYGTPRDSSGTIFPNLPRWLFINSWINTGSTITYNLDDMYLEFGRTFNFNPFTIRTAFGAEYAALDSTQRITSQLEFVEDEIYGYDNINRVRGIGPRVAANMAYELGYGFDVFADANLAMLISERKLVFDSLNIDGGKCPGIFYHPRRVVIPEIGVKLGLGYKYRFGCEFDGNSMSAYTLSIRGGWQGTTYVHAIERVLEAYVLTVNESQTTRPSNYSNQGFFLGATLSYDKF